MTKYIFMSTADFKKWGDAGDFSNKFIKTENGNEWTGLVRGDEVAFLDHSVSTPLVLDKKKALPYLDSFTKRK